MDNLDILNIRIDVLIFDGILSINALTGTLREPTLWASLQIMRPEKRSQFLHYHNETKLQHKCFCNVL